MKNVFAFFFRNLPQIFPIEFSQIIISLARLLEVAQGVPYKNWSFFLLGVAYIFNESFFVL